MPSFLSGVTPMFKSLFKSQKSLEKWVESVTTDEILESLTKVYIEGSVEEGIGPALTVAELSELKKNAASISQTDSGISSLLSFFAGYPFKSLPLPLSEDDLLRAVTSLTGKDAPALDTRQVAKNGSGEEKILKRGRAQDDKLRLIFAALAGGVPSQEDVADVLSLVQPRPDTSRLPLGQEAFKPMATRLSSPAPAAASIPKETLVTFFKAIELEAPAFQDNVDLESFKTIVGAKAGFFETISERASVFLTA